jgi:hypothetical protein
MATCHICNRSLPPNGKCQYCGDNVVRGGSGAGKGKGQNIWVSRLITLVIVGALGGGVYWAFFTPDGLAMVAKVKKSLGIGPKERVETPAIKILKKFKKVAALMADPNVTITEEKLNDNGRQVTFSRVDGDRLYGATFNVNIATGQAVPMDGSAKALVP